MDLARLKNEKLLQISDWKKIDEILNPSQKELEKLGEREAADCYYPRHAIIFYNEADSVIGLIEICLECDAYRNYGICNTWGINITPNGYKNLDRLFGRNNLLEKNSR